MLPATTRRVRDNTDEAVNRRIELETTARIKAVKAAGLLAIERRLRELDEEWDIERYLETMAPSFTLLGISLGLTRHRAWFVLPVLVQSFFLLHALQGWCPPVPLLRRLGVRTSSEIERERCALQGTRGAPSSAAEAALDTV